MLNRFKFQKKKSMLDEEIERVLTKMKGMNPQSQLYADTAEHLKTLYETKNVSARGGISADTMLTVGANILMMLIILNYEKTSIITSKAFGFVGKNRGS